LRACDALITCARIVRTLSERVIEFAENEAHVVTGALAGDRASAGAFSEPGLGHPGRGLALLGSQPTFAVRSGAHRCGSGGGQEFGGGSERMLQFIARQRDDAKGRLEDDEM
jgi:hypothetical protein